MSKKYCTFAIVNQINRSLSLSLSLCLSLSVSVCLPVCLPVCLSVCLSLSLSIVSQINIGTVSKATLGKLLRDGVERIWAFLSVAELSC